MSSGLEQCVPRSDSSKVCNIKVSLFLKLSRNSISFSSLFCSGSWGMLFRLFWLLNLVAVSNSHVKQCQSITCWRTLHLEVVFEEVFSFKLCCYTDVNACRTSLNGHASSMHTVLYLPPSTLCSDTAALCFMDYCEDLVQDGWNKGHYTLGAIFLRD